MRYRTGDPGYAITHRRLGRASDYQCELHWDERCRGAAQDWALDWRVVDPADLVTDNLGRIYSRGLDSDYVPACKSCHSRMDQPHGPAHNASPRRPL